MDTSSVRYVPTIANPLDARHDALGWASTMENVVTAVRIFSESLLANRVPLEVRREVKALAAHMEVLASRRRLVQPRSPSATETRLALRNLRRYLERETNKDRWRKKQSPSCTDTLESSSSQDQFSPCSCLQTASGYCNSRGDANSHRLPFPMPEAQGKGEKPARLYLRLQTGSAIHSSNTVDPKHAHKMSPEVEHKASLNVLPLLPWLPSPTTSSRPPSHHSSPPPPLPLPSTQVASLAQPQQAQELASLRHSAQSIRLTHCSELLPLLLLSAKDGAEAEAKAKATSAEDTRVHVLTEWAPPMRSPEAVVASAALVESGTRMDQVESRTFEGCQLVYCRSPFRIERAPRVTTNQPLQKEMQRTQELAIESTLDPPDLFVAEPSNKLELLNSGCFVDEGNCLCDLNINEQLSTALATEQAKFNYASVRSSLAMVGWAKRTKTVVFQRPVYDSQSASANSKQIVQEQLTNHARITYGMQNQLTENNQSTSENKLIACNIQAVSDSTAENEPIACSVQTVSDVSTASKNQIANNVQTATVNSAISNQPSMNNKPTACSQPVWSNRQRVSMNFAASSLPIESYKPTSVINTGTKRQPTMGSVPMVKHNLTFSPSNTQLNNQIIVSIVSSKEVTIQNQPALSIDSTESKQTELGLKQVTSSHRASAQAVSTCSYPSDNENEQPVKNLRDMEEIILEMHTSSAQLQPLEPALPLGHGSIDATTIRLLQGVCESSGPNDVLLSSAGVSTVSPLPSSHQQPLVRIVNLLGLVRTAELLAKSENTTEVPDVTLCQSSHLADVINKVEDHCARSNSTLEVVDNSAMPVVIPPAAARTACILEPEAGVRAGATWSSCEMGPSSGFTKLLLTLDKAAKRRREQSRCKKRQNKQKQQQQQQQQQMQGEVDPSNEVQPKVVTTEKSRVPSTTDNLDSPQQPPNQEQEQELEQKQQRAVVSADSATTGVVTRRQEEALKLAAQSLTELTRSLQACIQRVHQAADIISRNL